MAAFMHSKKQQQILWYLFGCICPGDEERLEHGHHVHLAQTFFPSAVCAVVLPIIHLLEDGEVGYDGVAGEIFSFFSIIVKI